MGFPVDAGLINGMDVQFIRNPNEKISIRFTAQQSGTVTKIVTDAFAYEGQPIVRAGIQEDNDGNPTGHWIRENAFGTIELSSGTGFKIIQFQASASLAKGQIYHIVFEAAENTVNGVAGVITYHSNNFARPLNLEDPDVVWSDILMDTLIYNGQSWQEQGKMPIFIIEYLEGASEGQPYSLSAPWVIWGSTYVGQMLIPASDYKVGKIAFDVSFKSDQPQDNLYYQIRDSSNNKLSEGLFAQTNQLTASQTWIETTLSTSITLKAGQIYRIFLLSPQTTLASAYHVYGHEFCYDPLIGYGSLQHQLTSSLDSGGSWGDNSDADAIFKLTTSG